MTDFFISAASHELKTPLATLKGFIQILQTQQDPKQTKYYLSKINNQIDRMSKLVEELLDVSRIKSGKLKLSKERFNLVKLVKDSCNDFSLITKSHQIILEDNIGLKVIAADKNRIYEVLNNLLSNAIKFSPQADKVVVKLKLEPKKIIISVTDFGIGISENNLAKISEPFFQASNRIRQSFGGLGLGLYITSQIIKSHHGKMWINSEKGKGSTFFFSLPV